MKQKYMKQKIFYLDKLRIRGILIATLLHDNRRVVVGDTENQIGM